MRPEIRLARQDETARCRALLPEAFPLSGWPPDLIVAVQGAEVAGAAALAWVPRGFPVLVRVAAGWRGRGIGRALLAAAAERAAGETMALRAWGPLDEDSPAAGFLMAAGFRVSKRLAVFETDGARFAATTGALLGRREGRVPPGARLVALAEAPRQDVVRLVAAQMALLPHDVSRQIETGAYDGALSLVLLHEGGVAGAMLAQRDGDRADIEVNVVAPALRRGWANLVLLEAMARRGRAAGIARFRFSCEEHVRDTMNLGRRCGARLLPPQLVLTLPLHAAAAA